MSTTTPTTTTAAPAAHRFLEASEVREGDITLTGTVTADPVRMPKKGVGAVMRIVTDNGTDDVRPGGLVCVLWMNPTPAQTRSWTG